MEATTALAQEANELAATTKAAANAAEIDYNNARDEHKTARTSQTKAAFKAALAEYRSAEAAAQVAFETSTALSLAANHTGRLVHMGQHHGVDAYRFEHADGGQ